MNEVNLVPSLLQAIINIDGEALVMHAGMFHPPLDVLAAIHARRADVLADGEGHRPAGTMNLMRKLEPGCRSADDEDTSEAGKESEEALNRKNLSSRA